MLLHTSLKVKRSGFAATAQSFATVYALAVHHVAEHVAKGDFVTASDDEEWCVLKLMKEVQVVTSHVPGLSAACVAMRNEIHGLMIHLGLPSFFLTINPADVYNPLVKFLAGADIDMDNMLEDKVPKYWDQTLLVVKNPIVSAWFFSIVMKAFIKTVLGFDPGQSSLEGGILGIVKGYYGCVESQGRGTLHCHMLVWIEGGLNPNKIRDKVMKADEEGFHQQLLTFLDDSISTCIPPQPDVDTDPPDVLSSRFHPCTVRNPLSSHENHATVKAQDLQNIVKTCQLHRHQDTCFKYSPDKQECCFGLNTANYNPSSTFDPKTGELRLRCLDGLVNNFNATIL